MTDTNNAGVTADPAITRAILELLPPGARSNESGLARCLWSDGVTASEDDIYKNICIAKLDRLIEYGNGFGNLKITTKGVERLQELIHRDMTRVARAASNAALADILSEMRLSA